MTLVNLTGFQWGVENDETGIQIESFENTVKPEFKEFVKDKVGEKRGFAVGAAEQEIAIEGEISGSTGLMAATFTTAVTLANDVDYFGQIAGGIYMDEGVIRQGRDGWKRLSMKCSRNSKITSGT